MQGATPRSFGGGKSLTLLVCEGRGARRDTGIASAPSSCGTDKAVSKKTTHLFSLADSRASLSVSDRIGSSNPYRDQ